MATEPYPPYTDTTSLFGLGITGIALGSLDLIKSIVEQSQWKCIVSTLEKWDRSGEIADYSVPITQANETVRPAIVGAIGIYDVNVPLTNLFGHGVIVNTKDDYLVFIGRVNSNWGRVLIAQGGKTFNKYLGKRFLSKLVYASNNLLSTIQQGISVPWAHGNYSIDTVEFGAIVLGKREIEMEGKPWVNTYSMTDCQGGPWYQQILNAIANFFNWLFSTQMTLNPQYTSSILRLSRNLNYAQWPFSSKDGFYSAGIAPLTTPFRDISATLPFMYLTVSIAANLIINNLKLIVSPVTFIGQYVKNRLGLSFSVKDILKVGIGSPLQSSLSCGTGCSQYGNFGQVIGLGSFSEIKIGSINLGSQDIYFAIPHPDYGNYSLSDLESFFKLYYLEDVIKLGILFAVTMDSISDQIRKQYGDYAVKLAYEWTPYSEDENEIRSEAFSVAQQANNIYTKAREELNRIREYSALSYVEECVVEYFDPGLSEEEIVKQVVGCAIAKAIYYREDYYEEE